MGRMAARGGGDGFLVHSRCEGVPEDRGAQCLDRNCPVYVPVPGDAQVISERNEEENGSQVWGERNVSPEGKLRFGMCQEKK